MVAAEVIILVGLGVSVVEEGKPEGQTKESVDAAAFESIGQQEDRHGMIWSLHSSDYT
jgi:hypothetical protein